uniref:Sugar ABC transporter substrate-binding protein n=1 Tax=Anaerolinea thermolimosa TaxID=229919 RepID=A0A7C4KH79_9CHLR
MKKMYPFLTGILCLVLILSACTPNVSSSPTSEQGAQPSGQTETSGEKVVLNIWGFEGETDFFPKLIEAFEAENPNIKVELTEIPESDYVTKMDTAMLAGEGPDIAFVYVPRWLKAGKFLALDEAIKQYNIPFDDFNRGAITRDCVFEGKVYCLGTYTGAIIMVYNKKLFDQFGVPYPSATEPMSMQEYFDMTLKLTRKSDNLEERIWGGDAQPHLWWMDWRTHISDDGRKIDGYVNDDPTVKAYQLMADMRKAGSAMTSSEGSLVQMEGIDLLVQGKLATTIIDNIISIPAVEQAGIEWGAAIVPTEEKGDPAWTTTWTDGFGVLSSSKHPNEAIKFVAFMGTKGNELRLELGDMPLNMKLAEKWVGDSEGRKQAFEAIKAARENLFCPGYWEATALVWDAWTSMTEEGVSAKEALDKVAPEMQKLLDQSWETFEEASR